MGSERLNKADVIFEVIDYMVDSCLPIADSSYDSKVLDNIEIMFNIADYCVANLCEATEAIASRFGSCQDCGYEAMDYIKQLKSTIEDYMMDEE